MKKYFIIFLFMLLNVNADGQDTAVKKPSYVILINDSIVSKETVDKYAASGYVKSMNKGVSEQEYQRLRRRFGDTVGQREFIITVVLLTEAEKLQKEQLSKEKRFQTPSSLGEKLTEEFLIKEGEPAEDFTVTLSDGKKLQLSKLKGKVVLLNFWATWCAPCLMEFYDVPHNILRPFSQSDLIFLPIAKGETKKNASEKMKQLKKDGINFPFAWDPEEVIWKKYAKGSIPKNILIDKKGIVRYVSVGYAEKRTEDLSQKIKKLLDE